MTHKLPEIQYAYNALEPYIDAQTMEIHHTKHHQTYVDKLNAALEKHGDLQNKVSKIYCETSVPFRKTYARRCEIMAGGILIILSFGRC